MYYSYWKEVTTEVKFSGGPGGRIVCSSPPLRTSPTLCRQRPLSPPFDHRASYAPLSSAAQYLPLAAAFLSIHIFVPHLIASTASIESNFTSSS
nr:hypothetical protein Iba_chr07fCG7500 [Ipomoea batatas]